MNYFKKIYKILGNYWIVIFLSICVGALSILPYCLARYSLSVNYKGMPALIQDSEGEYLSRIYELTEGHYSVASPVFYEYKDWPSIVPAVGEWLYAIPVYIFGVSVVGVDMFYKFLLPSLLFLLSYFLFKKLMDDLFFWSILGALVVSFGFDLASFSFIKQLFFGHFSAYTSAWTRPVNPITGMMFLALFLNFVYKIFNGENRKRFVVLSGIILSLMIGYFFSFVYAGVLTLLLLCFSLIKKNYLISLRILSVLLIGGFGMLVLLGPSVISLILGKTIGGLNDPQLQGLFYTRLYLINKTSLLFTLLFAIFTVIVYLYNKQKLWFMDWWVFCAGLLVTNQIVFNIQIVLGWTIWPQHFAQYTNIILCIVLVVILSRGVAPIFPRLAKWSGFLIIGVIVLLLVRTIPSYKDALPVLKDFQKERGVMDWLNANNQNDCVVFVIQDDTFPLQLNRFVSGFTNCDVYNSYHVYQGVPRERVFHNMLSWFWLRGIDEKELPSVLDKESLWIRSYLFRDWRDIFCCGGDPWVAKLGTEEEWTSWYDSEKERTEKSYGEFIKKDIQKELNKYRLDYVIIEETTKHRDLSSVKWLELVYSKDGYQIYSFKK